MEELIKQAFLHVDVLGPHVQEGHYDLIGPNGDIILPEIWEQVIEPGWAITMHMWPMDKAPLPSRPHAMPAFSHRPPGMSQPPPPPPPPPGYYPLRPAPPAAPAVVTVEPGTKRRKAGGPSQFLGWMTGNKTSRAKTDITDTSPTISSRSRASSVDVGIGGGYLSAPSRKEKEPAPLHGAGHAIMPFRGTQRSMSAAQGAMDLSWGLSKKPPSLYSRSQHRKQRQGSLRLPPTVSHFRSRRSSKDSLAKRQGSRHGDSTEDNSEDDPDNDSDGQSSRESRIPAPKTAGEDAQREAARKGLIVVHKVKHHQGLQGPPQAFRRRQTIRLLERDVSNPCRMEIKSARVDWEQLATGDAPSLELIRSREHPASGGPKSQLDLGGKQITWL